MYVYVCVYIYMGLSVSSSCSPHGTRSNTSHHRHCGRDLQLQIAVHARQCMYSIDYIYFYLFGDSDCAIKCPIHFDLYLASC